MADRKTITPDQRIQLIGLAVLGAQTNARFKEIEASVESIVGGDYGGHVSDFIVCEVSCVTEDSVRAVDEFLRKIGVEVEVEVDVETEDEETAS